MVFKGAILKGVLGYQLGLLSRVSKCSPAKLHADMPTVCLFLPTKTLDFQKRVRTLQNMPKVKLCRE